MKQIKTITSYLKEINEDPIKSEFIEYDQAGNIVLSIKYDEEGNIIEKSEFTYDNDNRKLTEKQYLSEDEIAEEHRFTYDDKGELSEIHTDYAEGYSSTRKIQYNPKENERIELEIDEDDEMEEKHVFKYHETHGKLTERAEYDDREKLVQKTVYTYDDKGRVIEQSEYERKGKKPIQTRQYAYNDESDKIEQLNVLNHKGKLINQYRLFYDEHDRVTRQISPTSGSIEIEYPSEKVQIERNIDASGNVQNETKSLFDDAGNLIKEEGLMLSKTHEITYYEAE
ncbi:MAG: hypothetical protein PF448_13945 [Bacteroidales bacterium]|jgi:hypothetical protein|nr:hypothetical protein [Bacteroidales bacterium]